MAILVILDLEIFVIAIATCGVFRAVAKGLGFRPVSIFISRVRGGGFTEMAAVLA